MATTLRAHWRIMTDVARTPDEFGVLLRGLLARQAIALREVTGVAIGSVVPPVTAPLAEACRAWLPATRVEIIDARSPLPITLDVDEPLTVGADRIINTLAASRRYARDAIVVDLGTATTFDCITKDARLPRRRDRARRRRRRRRRCSVARPSCPRRSSSRRARVIGTRTEECIRAGSCSARRSRSTGSCAASRRSGRTTTTPIVIGDRRPRRDVRAPLPAFDAVDPYLTLHGLALAFAAASRAPDDLSEHAGERAPQM